MHSIVTSHDSAIDITNFTTFFTICEGNRMKLAWKSLSHETTTDIPFIVHQSKPTTSAVNNFGLMATQIYITSQYV